MAGQKRALNSARLKASIHKPFRSPLRLTNDASEQPKPATNISTARDTLSSTPSDNVSKSTTLALQSYTSEGALALSQRQPKVSPPHASSSTLRKPMLGVRRPFRSPIAQGDRSQQNPGDSPHSRLIQIQALQSEITELQSSIRKGRQVLLQQERTDAPLEDLIDKWRKASQEAAQVLLDKYVAQEQVFGGSGYGDAGSDASTEAGRRSSYSQFSSWGYAEDSSQRDSQGLSELDSDQIQAMEERMKTQDVQHDLPTVEEAIRTRFIPDSDTEMEQPRVMTKMQRLLMGLGIMPEVIGYDAEQDAFTSEELPYDSS
ncbi:hypothetical protein BGZ58_004249 [Dissophora ornata]|nr:hypothetical protein BGZ58_004249 [Dissophora ornata]